MEILIYIVIPCVGSVFLLGGMFYGAYRMSGYAGLPGREDRLLGEDMPRRKDVSRLRGAPGQEGMARRKGISRLRGMAGEKRMSWRESMFRRGLPGRTLGIISAYILVCVAFSSLGNTWVNLFFQFLFPLVAWRAYGTPKIYCLYYLILSVAVWLTDVAAVLTYQVLVAEGALYLNAPQLQYILLVAATRMAEFMVILLVSMAVGRRAGRHITVRQVALSVLLPLYSVFNMYCMLYLVQIFPTKEMLVLLGINLLLLIGLNIYFCVLVDVMSENHRLENERNLYRAQARMQHQYYEREEEKYEASRKLIHDIRNHIQAMEALYAREHAGGVIGGNAGREASGAAEGDTCGDVPYAAGGSACGDAFGDARSAVCEDSHGAAHIAEKYAGDIHRMLNSFQQRYYTSEKLLNIILNDKAKIMQRLNVMEDMKVGELSLDFMREMDVTALFANLLDNAVAAAAESREKYVRLRVNRVRQFLSVILENSCDTAPVKAGSTFRSRQAGHQGLGLKIIRQTVEQYGGDMQMDWKDGVFTVRVMLTAEALTPSDLR
ncbi:ATP-binding protein [uncultured Acetatifactor sp.]|uniref:ATP-binding protein n=1 Tax=uncultured Acetatifactor sp. TaxID=1671927 RepID=UPI00272CF06C|nr:ATP-binding protein [uncultured Acetatifactor sp.]